MWIHFVAILGLGALCGGWVLVQRWVARRDPAAPGVEGRCGSCVEPDCETPGGRPVTTGLKLVAEQEIAGRVLAGRASGRPASPPPTSP